MRTRTFIGNGHQGLEAFVHHLARIERAVANSGRTAMAAAAIIIERDAKRQIGTYQPGVGDFPAWAPLSADYEAAKVAAGGKANAPLLFSGEMRDSIDHTVSATEAVVGAKDEKMVYHEFGTSKMPPRPVFGPAMLKTRKEVEAALGQVLLGGILGGEQVEAGRYLAP